MLVTETDVAVADIALTNSRAWLTKWLEEARYTNESRRSNLGSDVRLVSYGKNSLPLQNVWFESSQIDSRDKAEWVARWFIKSYEHAWYLSQNPKLFLDIINGNASFTTVKHAGLESYWTLSEVSQMFFIKRDSVDKWLSPIATRSDEDYRGTSYIFNDPLWHGEFIGDANKPLLQRAWYSAKRDLLNYNSWRHLSVSDNVNQKLAIYAPMADTGAKITTVNELRHLVELTAKAPDLYSVRNQRANLLNAQVRQQQHADNIRRQLSGHNFAKYWDNMKTRVRSAVPDESQTAEQFATIPLLPEGTESSRTWGIEVETVRAQLTERPRGWEAVYDGSLNSSSGDCNCECGSCYDDDHCNDHSDDCYYDSDGESKEFVSPVLSHFNSTGLRQLCSDLPTDEDDESPGIHVHVNGGDLTVTDVARLLVAYSAIAPLLKPLYHRQTYQYCHEMASDNLQWWLGQARKYLQERGSVPSPRDICELQPATRYQDVNVHALAKHGTIEFRAMGPFYDYDHLVRWAWFVREMVNVSKLGIPQSEWTRCRSLLDVIKLLRKYGSEIPSNKQFDSIDTKELQLSYGEQ